jgi:N-acyl-L-homoserine lactone synthetase
LGDNARMRTLAAAAVAAVAAVALASTATSAVVPNRLRLLRALTAAGLTAISVAYAYALAAATVVAGSLDVPFFATLVRMGPEMTFAIADARTGPIAIAVLAFGALAAATAAWWRAGRAPG